MSKEELYKQNIIKQLYFERVLSATDLSSLIKKSIPYTTRLINALLDEDVITDNGLADSSGGRKPQTYSLIPGLKYIIAVAMDQFNTQVGLYDLHQQEVCPPKNIELPLANNTDALITLSNAVNDFISNSGINKSQIIGMGIGMPGFINTKKGINYSFLHIPKSNIISYLKKSTQLPTFIANDSSVFALAELRLGAAKNKKNVMVVNIGWGIGLGLILKGQLYNGENGFAGEFSHIPLFDNRRICSCGKMGCLETEGSLNVMVTKARQGIQEGQSTIIKFNEGEDNLSAASAVMHAASKGDRFAISIIYEIGYNIGRGLSILIHLMNPQLIVLGGLGIKAGHLWLAPIQQAINEHCIPILSEDTSMKLTTIGEQAGLIGAAALVMDNIESTNWSSIHTLSNS
ncbi:ROK family protein [Membranihabitans marinus]|uniref:ROK family protein n=1 Tax=Membranihabitans marinus TaxID=1227546 RepID=UPI001F253653|nr:ROK family protein [Membranihabitans marinus]